MLRKNFIYSLLILFIIFLISCGEKDKNKPEREDIENGNKKSQVNKKIKANDKEPVTKYEKPTEIVVVTDDPCCILAVDNLRNWCRKSLPGSNITGVKGVWVYSDGLKPEAELVDYLVSAGLGGVKITRGISYVPGLFYG